ncbi:hypothetical protein [Microbacterium aquimaris]|uniref:Glycosyltransferase RgtA/B/C/D-like domain-containing protein n=1 Tax=Microbacterium aquimaris TaxID=459816 RepID=A0ABU5N856_9MICO|nr:hypothetical protein [Microbacterium aquimaris]MDZ8162273.1 hypothetical protein [Microbacterium aquimaris]
MPSDDSGARTGGRATVIGIGAALVLIVVAVTVPLAAGWDVATRAARSADDRAVAPLHGLWVPHVGLATAVAVLLAILAWRYADRLAGSLSWAALLPATFGAATAWMLALALVDGPTGISRVLGNPYEYLRTAREVDDIGMLLTTYISRIPLAADDNWVTHVAGHPPGMLLFFVALVRMGLGADATAGVVVTLIAATLPAAVLTTLRLLGVESVARRAAPFLVFTPAAVFLSVSADAVIATVGAWGVAALAAAATRPRVLGSVGWAAVAGVILGATVMMSYGMLLLGVVALAVLARTGRWLALPVAVAAAAGVVLVFASGGFAVWEAYPVLAERYADGIASRRPYAYWVWGNLAAFAICAGPVLGGALGAAAVSERARRDRVALWLIAAGAVMVLLADLSGMSKAEVERIWLPFVPWVTLAFAYVPVAWRSRLLAAQLIWALLVQHLLYTVW